MRRNISMRVALFVTCLVDLMRPAVGFAALALLERAAGEVVVPPGQTCCGQPAWSSGDRPAAAALAKKAIAELETYTHIVIPSGSCADQMKNIYPQLLADDPAWSARALALAHRTFELSTFLDTWLAADDLGRFDGSATYHDSCKGLRSLAIKEQPRRLLARVRGLQLQEMADCEECCGFGGAFAARYGELSTAIVDRKCDAIAAVGADAVVGGDLGCLLNIEGRLRRRGDERTRVLHIAELLAAAEGG